MRTKIIFWSIGAIVVLCFWLLDMGWLSIFGLLTGLLPYSFEKISRDAKKGDFEKEYGFEPNKGPVDELAVVGWKIEEARKAIASTRESLGFLQTINLPCRDEAQKEFNERLIKDAQTQIYWKERRYEDLLDLAREFGYTNSKNGNHKNGFKQILGMA